MHKVRATTLRLVRLDRQVLRRDQNESFASAMDVKRPNLVVGQRKRGVEKSMNRIMRALCPWRGRQQFGCAPLLRHRGIHARGASA